MKTIKSILLGVILMPVFAMAIGPWEVFEASFKSSKEYDNPYVDVFRPGRRALTCPGNDERVVVL